MVAVPAFAQASELAGLYTDIFGADVDAKRFDMLMHRAYLQEHLDDPALQKVYRNEKLTEPDYNRLENILLKAGIAHNEVITDASKAKGGLGLLIRSLVGLDEATARALFADFLQHNTATTAQMDYINTLIDELTRTGYVPRKRLIEPPYKTNYGTPATVFGAERATSLGAVLDEVEAAAKI